MAGRVCYAKIDQSKKKIVVFNANFAGTNGREPLSQPVPANGTTGTAWDRCRTEKPVRRYGAAAPIWDRCGVCKGEKWRLSRAEPQIPAGGAETAGG